MGEDKKDTKAKERSDSINNKIKWPFVIFFAIAIFVAISIVARVYQDKFNDLYTPALYLFSTIAQTMGALLGIGLALLYTAISSLKKSPDFPEIEPGKRLLLRDSDYRRSIDYGLVSILVSVISLFIIFVIPNSIITLVFIYILAISSISLALLSIINMIDFIRYKYRGYFDLYYLFQNADVLYNRIVREVKIHFKVDDDSLLDYLEVNLLLLAKNIVNKNTKALFRIICEMSITKDEIMKLLENTYDDIISCSLDIVYFYNKILPSLLVSFKDYYDNDNKRNNKSFDNYFNIINDVLYNYVQKSNNRIDIENLIGNYNEAMCSLFIYDSNFELSPDDDYVKLLVGFYLRLFRSKKFSKRFLLEPRLGSTDNIIQFIKQYAYHNKVDDVNFRELCIILRYQQIEYLCTRFIRNIDINNEFKIIYIAPFFSYDELVNLKITDVNEIINIFDNNFNSNTVQLVIFIILFMTNILLIPKNLHNAFIQEFDLNLAFYFFYQYRTLNFLPAPMDNYDHIVEEFFYQLKEYMLKSGFINDQFKIMLELGNNKRVRQESKKTLNNILDDIKKQYN